MGEKSYFLLNYFLKKFQNYFYGNAKDILKKEANVIVDTKDLTKILEEI